MCWGNGKRNQKKNEYKAESKEPPQTSANTVDEIRVQTRKVTVYYCTAQWVWSCHSEGPWYIWGQSLKAFAWKLKIDYLLVKSTQHILLAKFIWKSLFQVSFPVIYFKTMTLKQGNTFLPVFCPSRGGDPAGSQCGPALLRAQLASWRPWQAALTALRKIATRSSFDLPVFLPMRFPPFPYVVGQTSSSHQNLPHRKKCEYRVWRPGYKFKSLWEPARRFIW